MLSSHIKASLQEAKSLLDNFLSKDENLHKISQVAEMMAVALSSGNKIMSCGNGGSMCDAMHFSEELTGRFRKERAPLPALAISDPSHLSCVGNDYGFDAIFSRYVEAHGRPGDVLLVLSTSGNSSNIIKAVKMAQEKDVKVVALLGKNGGDLLSIADIPLNVGGKDSDRVQEMHIKVIHILIECIERKLFPENYL